MATTPPERFANLHAHSEYSLLDGYAHVKDMAKRAKEMGQKALAITDHGNMYGAIPFYQACKEEGVNPIVGIEFYVAPGDMREKPGKDQPSYYHLIALAENFKGYQNLMKLATMASLEGFYSHARIDHRALEENGEGLFLLSGCLGGELAQSVIKNDSNLQKKTLDFYKGAFKDHYAIEIQNHGIPEEDLVRAINIDLALKHNLPIVATGDSHMAVKEQHRVHEMLLCLQTNKVMSDPKRFKLDGSGYYLPTVEEMLARFQECPEAVTNSYDIVKDFNLELPIYGNQLPKFTKLPNKMSSEDYLKQLCKQGLSVRFGDAINGVIAERLRNEVKVITGAGFADYFLIVWDVVKWAKDQGISVGPGRGSAAGSLVAYLLGITDIDPMRYDLLFERFLNAERTSMPDIDLDIDIRYRGAMIDYTSQTYGANRVAQLITFNTLGAKAALKGIARVNEIPFMEANQLSKVVQGIEAKLSDFQGALYEVADRGTQKKKLRSIIDDAMQIEGYVANAGKHAAGVIIAPEPLVNIVPLQRPVKGEGGAITQYDLDVISKLGLLKIDFLGLKNLSIIKDAIDLIEENYGIKLNMQEIPLDDKETFEMLRAGDVVGVFQMEGRQAKDILQKLNPDCIEDIAAANALNRPGPLSGKLDNGETVVQAYINRKKGLEPAVSIIPETQELLKDSYGLILYQDQVMQIANSIAGYSLIEADTLRAAMGKKDVAKMAKEKDRFITQAVARGTNGDNAARLWDYINKFSAYGFNKAHAVAYGTVGYQTAYLKCHYPLEYMVGLCNSRSGLFDEDEHNMQEAIVDAKMRNIVIEKPDINESGVNFMVHSRARQTIIYGLSQIKGVGEKVVEMIVAERDANGAYQSLSDLVRRNLNSGIKKDTLEPLILSGACDDFGKRDLLLEQVPELVKNANTQRRRNTIAATALATGVIKKTRKPLEELIWPDQNLEVTNKLNKIGHTKLYTLKDLEAEADVLGMTISGQIMDAYQEPLKKFGVMPIHQMLTDPSIPVNLRIAGRIKAKRFFPTKNGNLGMRLVIEDASSECVVWGFSNVAEETQTKFDKSKGPIMIRGSRRINTKDGGKEISFSAQEVTKLEEPVISSGIG